MLICHLMGFRFERRLNVKIFEMLVDYCRRVPKTITPEQLVSLIENNHFIVEDDCFIIFAASFDEMRILCPYAPLGKSIEPLGRRLEQMAKDRGFKRISIITDRGEAFGRKFKDYSPVAVVYEKNLERE